MVRTFLATTAIASALLAQAAAGQTTPQATTSEAAADPDATDIVVTGSRLAGRAVDSPAPIVTIGTAEIAQSGTDNLADILTDLPSVGVGLTDTNTQNLYALAGLNLIDLRNLGYNRTLVLVNGRRQVAGDIFTNAVDINSIPAPLVERVELVTGGASAVYGADAVSGVVNVILRKNVEGLEARVRSGITSRGDGASYSASLTGGTNFADGRGNLSISATYDKTEGVKADSRRYTSNGLNTIVNPADRAANDGIPSTLTRENIRFFGPNQLGLIDLGAFGVFVPTADGTDIRPFNFGAIGNSAGRSVGGDGGFFEKYDNLQLPIERYGLSANLSYDVTEGVELFLEGRFLTSRVRTRWQPAADFEYGGPFIATTNPYVPARLRAGLQQAGAPGFVFQRVYEDFGRRGADDERTTQQYTGGLRGELAPGLRYEAFAGYGRTKLDSVLVGGRNQARFLQSVNVALVNGAPACADAAARTAGCQPLNVFNPASTPAGIAYSLTTDTYSAFQELKMAGATITGSVFDLPGGPVGFVVGVEARENRAETNPSAATQAGGIQLLFEKPTRGRVTVKEAFGELKLPLLKDITLINELTLQGAARVSDYNVNGTQFSWNAGGVYSPVESIRFRVMRSRSVRAPTVDELFSTQSQTFLNLNDPCSRENVNLAANRATNCAALGIPTGFTQTTGSKATFTGGNPNLDPEEADTWTAGVVLTPTFVPGLTITADWFDISIEGAIGAIPAQTTLDNCVGLAVAPASNPLCGAITRDATTRQVTGVFGTNLNVGALKTRGIDASVSYARPLSGLGIPGRLGLLANFTYLDRLRQFTDANNPNSQNKFEGFRGRPKYQAQGNLTYATDSVAITWRTTYYSSTSVALSDLVAFPRAGDTYDRPFTGAETFHDLSISLDVTDRANFRLNVNNILDNKPPLRGFNIHQGLGAASIYPNLGTTFSTAFTFKF